MTDRKGNPLASAGAADDATGVDSGSDDWAKAVIDGLKADDARSDNARQSGSSPTGEASAESSDDSASTLAPVADRHDDDDVIGEEMAKTKRNDQDSDSTRSGAGVDADDENPLCTFPGDADAGQSDEGSEPAAAGAIDADGESVTLADAEVVGLDGAESPPPPQGPPLAPGSVEDLVSDLERVTGERDTYLESSRRIQAEFENYRKQVGKRETEARERANESLVAELLPVLDACDGAVANGADDVVPISTSLLEALTKQGLERLDPADAPFDPEFHEAVMHEDGDGDNGPVVAEVMRAGYTWKGRVVRPAMVRVRG